MRLLATLAILHAAGACAARAQSRVPSPESRPFYLVYVASEGNDRIQLVRFDGTRATVERSRRVGASPAELLGPHGIALSPDGRHYFVTTAHGTPNGALWKYTTAGDTLVGRVELGAFPATLQVSPDGAYVWVANFALYGDRAPSTVSVVYGDDMVEVARIPTCAMPHGSRLNAEGSRHYSVCMMSDVLVEIDARTLAVTRHLVLTPGRERGMAGAPGAMSSPMSSPMAAGAACSPTWAQPSPDGARVWVACNATSDIVEIGAAAWRMTRRFPAGDGVYNLAVTHDGRLLIATDRRAQAASVIDAATGKELARIRTTRALPSGVAVSADDRYAFVTDEGVGSEPGTLDVIDLRALARVASVDVGQQAGGVDVMR